MTDSRLSLYFAPHDSEWMRQLVGVLGERAASCGQSMSMPRPPKQDFAELSRGVSASTYGEKCEKQA
jgi:hypothetical protein